MSTAAERYEQIVQVVHRYRSALPEGHLASLQYIGWVMSKVYEIVGNDDRQLTQQDFQDADKDTDKLKDKYFGWAKEIYAEVEAEQLAQADR